MKISSKSKISINLSLCALLFFSSFFAFQSNAWAEDSSASSAIKSAEQERVRKEINRHLDRLVKAQTAPGGWLGDGKDPKHARIIKDIFYVTPAASPSQALDLYIPQTETKDQQNGSPSSAHPPLVVWIHGGGWRGGDKKGGPIEALLNAGYAVASINYRLSGEAKWPAQLDDCQSAMKWVNTHAQEYGIDNKQVGLWGASAGGHLVLLLALKDGTANGVKAACDWFGPVDLVGYLQSDKTTPNALEMIKQVLTLNPNEFMNQARDASPITYIDTSKELPALMVVHGKDDPLVPVGQSELLVEKLKTRNNVNVALSIVKGGHGYPGFGADTVNDTINFFTQNLLARPKATVD